MGKGGGGGDFPPKKECLSDESGFPEKKPARQLDFTGGSDDHSLSKPAPAVVVSPSVTSPVQTTSRLHPVVRATSPVVTSQSQILNAPIRLP